MKKEISRRNFIKGTAALTAGAALMGLAGCAEEKTPAPQAGVFSLKMDKPGQPCYFVSWGMVIFST